MKGLAPAARKDAPAPVDTQILPKAIKPAVKK
jgi:hypothetical protein